MDTQVENVNENALIDIFPGLGQPTVGGNQVNFGGQANEFDVFGVPKSTTEETTLPSATGETTLAPSTTGETTEAPSTTGETTLEPNADILGQQQQQPKTTTSVKDLSAYYEERIKSGKFVAIVEEDDKGNKKPFIPQTAEEYDEVFELQVGHRLAEERKDLEKKWYESKTPAWKAISQYAEMVDDPTQLIPFLSGIKNLQSVANLNEAEIDGAEAIVRTRMEQRGDPEEVIASQIEALKTTDKLLATAKSMKPIIIQQEQVALQKMQKAEQEKQLQYNQMISEVRTNAITAIEKPIFGKQKLKQEEKALIYDLIAEPAEDTQGYGIYTAIDKLFDGKDFETLKEIALLLTKKDSFYNYLGTTVANNTAASLEKKLRLAGDAHRASGNDFDEEQENRPTVRRDQFMKKPNFSAK